MSAILGMLLAGGPTVTLSDENVAASDGGITGQAAAGYRLEASGIVEVAVDNSTDLTGDYNQVNADTDWIRPESNASGAYEVRATLDSGDTPSGILNTWETLDARRSWSISRTTNGTSTANLTIEIRSGTTVLASASIGLQAEVSGA